LCFLITATLSAQTKYYDVNFKRELGYMGAGVGLSVLGIVLGNNADKSSIEEIRALDRMDISRFDRGATDNFSSTAQTVSDVLLYSGATLPFITYFSKSCRSQGGAIGVMAIETFLITNGITNITKSLAQRYRPFNYNPEVPDELKLSGGSRLSFFSGHASNTAAMSFFAAKVLTDIHPEMRQKGLIWTIAITLPATISYLRYEAGKHFPTDLITGYAVGATIGYLIPTLHLNKNMRLMPHGSGGLSLTIDLH